MNSTLISSSHLSEAIKILMQLYSIQPKSHEKQKQQCKKIKLSQNKKYSTFYVHTKTLSCEMFEIGTWALHSKQKQLNGMSEQ